MIASLSGTLVAKDGEGGIIECHGVGYGAAMSVTTLLRLGEVGAQVRVFVHTYVAEDALRLYAFATLPERRAFEILLGTTGVGPRLALAILSTLTPAELGQAVQARSRTALTRIPGVGPKKAERLLLELADRIDALGLGEAVLGPQADLISALCNLGFAPAVAEAAARASCEALPHTQDIATLMRHALRSIT